MVNFLFLVVLFIIIPAILKLQQAYASLDAVREAEFINTSKVSHLPETTIGKQILAHVSVSLKEPPFLISISDCVFRPGDIAGILHQSLNTRLA